MGLLSNLFGAPRVESLEERMVREYTEAFALTESRAGAAEYARKFVDEAMNEVNRRGMANEPANYGIVLLQLAPSKPALHAKIKQIENEGVRIEDFLWWWNMPALERVLIEKTDGLNRQEGFYAAVLQGISPEDAAIRMWKVHARYGDCASEEGEDRPLPIELKQRVLSFTEKLQTSPAEYRKLIEQFSTFNALVRAAMRQGQV